MPRKRRAGPRHPCGRLKASPDAARLAETIALEKARGGEVERVRGGPILMLDRDGLLWATKKASVTGSELEAAIWYRATHQMAAGAVKSALNALGVRRIGWRHMGPGDRKLAAYAELRAAEAAVKEPRLVTILDLVAGKGRTFREIANGDDVVAKRLENLFVEACRRLSHYTRSRPVSWLDAA